MVIGVIGIILSLILLMYLAYKGFSVLVLAPVLACFAAFLGGIATGEVHILATYTEICYELFSIISFGSNFWKSNG